MSNTPEEFYEQCKVAAILGTVQAKYADFKFVSQATHDITTKEALIGVGITGWMNNPDVQFDKEVMKKGADVVALNVKAFRAGREFALENK